MAVSLQDNWSDITINKELTAKLERFINVDQAYTDVIRNSALFNRRLAADRKMRLPYYDAQTGVAQHCTSLWMNSRQRMPGKDQGQIYSYPAKTWIKRRRQYLIAPPKKDLIDGEEVEGIIGHHHEDSRDTIHKEEGASKEAWYFDDNEETLDFDEPDPESDDDYTDSSRPRRKRRPLAMIKTPKREGRARKKAAPPVPPEPINEADKPYACALCPARYKTRPGLTYHYAHSHKDQPRPPIEHPSTLVAPDLDLEESSSPMDFDEAGRLYGIGRAGGRARPGSVANRVPSPLVETPKRRAAISPPRIHPPSPPPPTLVPQIQHFIQAPIPTPVQAQLHPQPVPSHSPSPHKEPRSGAPKAPPSPFCDFCLGDAVNNKKTGGSEELVSCSDCGRSGHPSCLQFTANMMVSVRKYRWQCIECKCCSLCGTSDNDEQLLFCDDCDRGYHMYCLKPPLSEPPEGSWSCSLCVREFHK